MASKNNKNLGQHWLKNREILERIADLAFDLGAAKSVKTCLEIGPGLGTLTSSLLKRFNKVIAVEYDARLAENLPASFPGKNLNVVNDDIMDFDLSTIRGKYVIAGNIPYYITSPIIGKIMEAEKKPAGAVLLMQKEVAERVMNTRGSTPLGLLVENQAEVEAGPIVKAKEFEPAPKVDSQVVVFKMRKQPLWQGDNIGLVALLYLAFERPRKKLLNNLQIVGTKQEAEEIMRRAEIDRNARPGDLSLQDYQRLWDAVEGMDSLKRLPIR